MFILHRNWHTTLMILVAITLPVQSASAEAAKPGGAGSQSAKAPASGQSIKKMQDQFFDIGPYMLGVREKIQKNWHAPANIKNVVLRWQIQPDGSISDLHIDKSSGDPANDKAALDAVGSSAPFAALPKGVPPLPIEFAFGNAIRSGLHEVSVSDQAAANSLYNEAVGLINKKEFPEGLDKLEFALDRDPKNTAISGALRYVSAYVTDETPDGLHLLYRVLAIDPRQGAALEKVKFFVRAKGQDPDKIEDRLSRGQAFLDQKDGEGALAEFTAANVLKANSASSDKMVECYRILAGHRMATKWQSVMKARKDAEGYCGLGRSYQLSGEYDKADNYYKQALDLDPTSDMAKSLLARLDDEKKNGTREIVATIAMAPHSGKEGGDLLPKAQILNNEGIDLLKANDFKGAIEKFREALTVDPSYQYARKNLATSYNNSAVKLPTKEAMVFYRRALYLNPDDPLVKKNLASCLRELYRKPDQFQERYGLAEDFAGDGDFVGAVVELREALAIKKDDAAEAKLKEYLKKAPSLP